MSKNSLFLIQNPKSKTTLILIQKNSIPAARIKKVKYIHRIIMLRKLKLRVLLSLFFLHRLLKLLLLKTTNRSKNKYILIVIAVKLKCLTPRQRKRFNHLKTFKSLIKSISKSVIIKSLLLLKGSHYPLRDLNSCNNTVTFYTTSRKKKLWSRMNVRRFILLGIL